MSLMVTSHRLELSFRGGQILTGYGRDASTTIGGAKL